MLDSDQEELGVFLVAPIPALEVLPQAQKYVAHHPLPNSAYTQYNRKWYQYQ
jgi:hypothetical protein